MRATRCFHNRPDDRVPSGNPPGKSQGAIRKGTAIVHGLDKSPCWYVQGGYGRALVPRTSSKDPDSEWPISYRKYTSWLKALRFVAETEGTQTSGKMEAGP